MMGFQTAWATLAIGAAVRVSNGQVAPNAGPDSIDYLVWRSHNFSGELVEKVDGLTRYLRFDLPETPEGNVIGYSISEDGAHSFEVMP